jgi:two-component system sensor histidine kinase BaeS
MRRSATLFWRVFLGVLVVALFVVTSVGVVARVAMQRAFSLYLSTLPSPMGMGMGRRMMFGGAEQTFLASVDRAVLLGGVVAIVLAALAAWLIARSLARPVRALEDAALALADGDLSSRVAPAGPEEIAALGEAFNRMADSLQRAEELRRRMVSDVAHELRNPIAAARAQAEGMAEGVLAMTPERIRSVTEDMEHLTALVDDLQQLAIAEAGQLRYDMHPLDIAQLACREARRAEALAAPGVTLATRGAEAPVTVTADERRISEVLRNLLGNAIRHTRTGSVTVEVSRTGESVTVRVIDTGEGIPDEDLPFVFERFYRADKSRTAATGGAGLGLAIARRIVEDHGGSVFAEKTPGGGATVGFTLPAR